MKTLSLPEAAAFLRVHQETLRQQARTGRIPGAKVGRAWVFLGDDLVAYLRGSIQPLGKRCKQRWESGRLTHVTQEAGPDLVDRHPRSTPDSEYADLLGLAARPSPRSTTTRSRQNSGGRKSSARSRSAAGKKQSFDG